MITAMTALATLLAPDLLALLVKEVAKPHFASVLVGRVHQSLPNRLDRSARRSLKHFVGKDGVWPALLAQEQTEIVRLSELIQADVGLVPELAFEVASSITRELEAALDVRTARAVAAARMKMLSADVAQILAGETTDDLQRVTAWSRIFEKQLEDLVEDGTGTSDPTPLYVTRDCQADICRRILHTDNAQVLVGEAGSGKSSLLLGIKRSLDDEDCYPMLVSAAWFLEAPTGAGAPDLEMVVQVALKMATSGLRSVVLLDTADLLLHSTALQTAVLVAADRLIAGGAGFVMTSRTVEARDGLPPDFADRDEIGRYNNSELTRAVTALIGRYCKPAAPLDAMLQIEKAVARGLPVKEVCESPLFVKLLFELAAPAFPELRDANVSDLYSSYWSLRVESDRRDGNASVAAAGFSGDCSIAAMSIAIVGLALGTPEPAFTHVDLSKREIWSRANVALDIGADDLAPLVSRGVALSDGSHIRFFHQTMFEYAAARGLLRRGGLAEIPRLVDRLLDRPQDQFLAAVVEQTLIVAGSYPFASEILAKSCARLLDSGQHALQALVAVVVIHHADALPADISRIRGIGDAAVVRFLRVAPSVRQVDLNALSPLVQDFWNRGDRDRRNAVMEMLSRLAVLHASEVRVLLEELCVVDYFVDESPNSLKNPSRLTELLIDVGSSSPIWVRESLLRVARAIKDNGRGEPAKLLRRVSEMWEVIGDKELGEALVGLFTDEAQSAPKYRELRAACGQIVARLWVDSATDLVMEARDTRILLNENPNSVRAGISLFALASLIAIGHTSTSETNAIFREVLTLPGRKAIARVPSHFLMPLLRSSWGESHALWRQMIASSLNGLPATPGHYGSNRQLRAGGVRAALMDENLEPGRLVMMLSTWEGLSRPQVWTHRSMLVALAPAASVGGLAAAQDAIVEIARFPRILDPISATAFMKESQRLLQNSPIADAAISVAAEFNQRSTLVAMAELTVLRSALGAQIPAITRSIQEGLHSTFDTDQESAIILLTAVLRAGVLSPDTFPIGHLLATARGQNAKRHLVRLMGESADLESATKGLNSFAKYEDGKVTPVSSDDPPAFLMEEVKRSWLSLLATRGPITDSSWHQVLVLSLRDRGTGQPWTIEGVNEANQFLIRAAEHGESSAALKYLMAYARQLAASPFSDKQLREASNRLTHSLHLIVRELTALEAAELVTGIATYPVTFAKFVVQTASYFHRSAVAPVLRELLETDIAIELAAHIDTNIRGGSREIGDRFPEVLDPPSLRP